MLLGAIGNAFIQKSSWHAGLVHTCIKDGTRMVWEFLT